MLFKALVTDILLDSHPGERGHAPHINESLSCSSCEYGIGLKLLQVFACHSLLNALLFNYYAFSTVVYKHFSLARHIVYVKFKKTIVGLYLENLWL